MTSSLSPSYFEVKYRENIDPWQFRTSDYERQKYNATIRALTRPRYRRALEVGCSIGVLTAMLAARCDHLVALDASQTAITEAERQKLPNVTFDTACLPDDFPAGTFDLIMLSEVLYYFSPVDLRRMADLSCAALAAGGEIILCHWLGETDYPLGGYQASDLFAAAVESGLPERSILHEEIYRLERLSGSPARAAAEG
jgi:SAM-dependent methyltransferase